MVAAEGGGGGSVGWGGGNNNLKSEIIPLGQTHGKKSNSKIRIGS